MCRASRPCRSPPVFALGDGNYSFKLPCDVKTVVKGRPVLLHRRGLDPGQGRPRPADAGTGRCLSRLRLRPNNGLRRQGARRRPGCLGATPSIAWPWPGGPTLAGQMPNGELFAAETKVGHTPVRATRPLPFRSDALPALQLHALDPRAGVIALSIVSPPTRGAGWCAAAAVLERGDRGGDAVLTLPPMLKTLVRFTRTTMSQWV